MNISLILQMAADADPERIGLVCDGRRWSYGALLRAAQGAAANIAKSGCSHVALLDESSEAAAIALFGAAIAGIPYVPLNYRLADADLAALLGRIAPACVIGDVERSNRLSPGQRPHVPLPRRTSSPRPKRQPTPHPARKRKAKASPCRSSPAAPPPPPRRHCCATPTCSPTSWAPSSSARHRRTKQPWCACRLTTSPVSRRCSARSTRCAVSRCCRPSIRIPGSPLPARNAPPTRSWCRPCWRASSRAWTRARPPTCPHCRRSPTVAGACRWN